MVYAEQVFFLFFSISFAVLTPAYTIYMGKDKYESKCSFSHMNFCVLLLSRLYFSDCSFLFSTDEDLIKYGWPEDIW